MNDEINKPNKMLDALTSYLESKEGKQHVIDYLAKEERLQIIKNSQFERFNDKLGNKQDFEVFVEKVIQKYNSKEYTKRWYSRGFVPPEQLFWFLFHYAKIYGRECTEEEYENYGSMFTADLIFCNGYYFNQMNGQGSVIHIIKEGNINTND